MIKIPMEWSKGMRDIKGALHNRIFAVLLSVFLCFLVTPIGGLFADIHDEPVADREDIFTKAVSETNIYSGIEITYEALGEGFVGLQSFSNDSDFRGCAILPTDDNVFIGWVDEYGTYLTDLEVYIPITALEDITVYAVFIPIDEISGGREELRETAISKVLSETNEYDIYDNFEENTNHENDPKESGVNTESDETNIEESNVEEESDNVDSSPYTEAESDASDTDYYTEDGVYSSDSDDYSDNTPDLSDSDIVSDSSNDLEGLIDSDDIPENSFLENTEDNLDNPNLSDNGTSFPSDSDQIISSDDDVTTFNNSNESEEAFKPIVLQQETQTNNSTSTSSSSVSANNENNSAVVAENSEHFNDSLQINNDNNSLTENNQEDTNNSLNTDISDKTQDTSYDYSSEEKEPLEKLPEDIFVIKDIGTNARAKDNEASAKKNDTVYNAICVDSKTNKVLSSSMDIPAVSGQNVSLKDSVESNYKLDSIGVYYHIDSDKYEDEDLKFYANSDDVIECDTVDLSASVIEEPEDNLSIVYYLSQDVAAPLSDIDLTASNQIIRPADNGLDMYSQPFIVFTVFSAAFSMVCICLRRKLDKIIGSDNSNSIQHKVK